MAKALFGHVGRVLDPQTVAELRALRRRVRALEDEVDRLRADAVAHERRFLVDEELITLDFSGVVTREPVLT